MARFSRKAWPPLLLLFTCIRGDDFYWDVQLFDYTINADSSRMKVIRGNNIFIGADGNQMVRSTDGIHWHIFSPNISPAPKNIAWLNGQYFAVADKVWTSPDAVTWTEVAAGFSPELIDIAWGNGQFIAVDGYDGMYQSLDAVNWSRIQPQLPEPPNPDYKKLQYALSKFYLLVDDYFGTTGSFLYSSNNGFNWTKQSLPLESITQRHYYQIECALSGCILGGYPDSYFSTDGNTWVKIEPALEMLTVAACPGEHKFIGARTGGGLFDAPRIFTTTDGLHWTEHYNASFGMDITKVMYPSSAACANEAYVFGGYCRTELPEPFNSYKTCIMHSP